MIENKAKDDFRVVRQDTHGNEFSVTENLNKEDADALAKEFEQKPHHQGYWAQPMSTPLKNSNV